MPECPLSKFHARESENKRTNAELKLAWRSARSESLFCDDRAVENNGKSISRGNKLSRKEAKEKKKFTRRA